MSNPLLRFPPAFIWGAATAAYQIEGSVSADGRGPSIWDTFSGTPGAVAGGDTGEVAVDHYRRMPQDVALICELGLDAYRFSVAWPRVQPDGSGAPNHAGLAFYDRLVDELLGAGIAPVLTLYHWDLPQALQDRGGWGSRDTAPRFAEYAGHVADELGDRVRHWTTLNEPWCSAMLGYASGEHAPGIRDQGLALRAAHHLLLAHGLALETLRDRLRVDAEVSLVLNVHEVWPASSAEEDTAAARHVDAVGNGLYLGPVLRGAYPPEVVEATRHLTDWAFVQDGDLAVTSAPVDALGVNYYGPAVVRAGHPGPLGDPAWPACEHVHFDTDTPGRRTAMGWLVDPAGLTSVLLRLADEAPGLPLLVTENGAAYVDTVEAGRVADGERVQYLREHLRAAHAAIAKGVDLRGYFVWSLLDNFEWAWGYDKRFGIVHVDYATQERTLKDSARFYRDVIARGGVDAP